MTELDDGSDVQGTLPFVETGPELGREELPRNAVRDAMGGYDALGRKVPHNPFAGYSGVVHLLRHAPSDRIRVVPHQAVDRSEEAPIVRCPCSVNCVVPYDTFMACPGCERYYVSTPSVVWVLYGDMELPGTSD